MNQNNQTYNNQGNMNNSISTANMANQMNQLPPQNQVYSNQQMYNSQNNMNNQIYNNQGNINNSMYPNNTTNSMYQQQPTYYNNQQMYNNQNNMNNQMIYNNQGNINNSMYPNNTTNSMYQQQSTYYNNQMNIQQPQVYSTNLNVQNNQNIPNPTIPSITIESLNQQRLELKKIYIICIIISIIIGILIIVLTKNIQTIFFGIFIGVIITAIFSSKKARIYNLDYKTYFVRTALTKIFSNIKYEPESGLDKSIIANTGMMYMGDRYSSNDLITGYYKNIAFTQSDVHIEERHEDSEGHTTYVTIFRGRWMIFDFNKQFKANVQVCQKGFGNNKVNSLFSKTKYKKVEMESKEFNKNFKVYAINPHDAFYILTPSLMEKIKKLDQMNTGKILLCFIDNKLHIGLYDNKDSFEHGSVFKELNETEITQNISKDINQITMFVDELNLDNDLFKNSLN